MKSKYVNKKYLVICTKQCSFFAARLPMSVIRYLANCEREEIRWLIEFLVGPYGSLKLISILTLTEK